VSVISAGASVLTVTPDDARRELAHAGHGPLREAERGA